MSIQVHNCNPLSGHWIIQNLNPYDCAFSDYWSVFSVFGHISLPYIYIHIYGKDCAWPHDFKKNTAGIPLLLAMKNKKPALQSSMMNVFLNLVLKISSSSWLPLVFQDKSRFVKNVPSKKKLKKCQFFWCNKAALAQTASATVQRHWRKTNTNKFLKSRAEDTRFFSSFHRIQTTLHTKRLFSRIKLI